MSSTTNASPGKVRRPTAISGHQCRGWRAWRRLKSRAYRCCGLCVRPPRPLFSRARHEGKTAPNASAGPADVAAGATAAEGERIPANCCCRRAFSCSIFAIRSIAWSSLSSNVAIRCVRCSQFRQKVVSRSFSEQEDTHPRPSNQDQPDAYRTQEFRRIFGGGGGAIDMAPPGNKTQYCQATAVGSRWP
jgi:hypothetical protein